MSEYKKALEKAGVGYLTKEVASRARLDTIREAIGGAFAAASVPMAAPENLIEMDQFKKVMNSFMIKQPAESISLHELIDAARIDRDSLSPVIQEMEKHGLVEYVEKDVYGNHKISLTPRAIELTKSWK